MTVYGLRGKESPWRSPRDVIGAVEAVGAGVALRLGREFSAGWLQTGYVVLTPDEAQSLAWALRTAVETGEGKEDDSPRAERLPEDVQEGWWQ